MIIIILLLSSQANIKYKREKREKKERKRIKRESIQKISDADRPKNLGADFFIFISIKNRANFFTIF